MSLFCEHNSALTVKDFMLSHSYIKNDFDVQKWAELEFLEQSARELLEDRWKKETSNKLPSASFAQRVLSGVPFQVHQGLILSTK